MKSQLATKLILVFGIIVSSGLVLAQGEAALEPDAIIQKILDVEARQRTEIHDVVFDAEYIERESNGKGGYNEKMKLEKKIRMKYLPDTTWYCEEYLRYYKNGEVCSNEERDEIAAERQDKKKQRGSRDVSYRILKPFYPESRPEYKISYEGIDDSSKTGYVSYHFKVISVTENEDNINGDYFFDAASFQLIKVNFAPAKLNGNFLFKLNELNMSMSFGPNSDGQWLPQQFDINGKGKAAFFIDVDWSGTEYFHNPQINTGISDSLFKAVQE